jgi:molybdopterin synthase sulfur carrier subunit
MSGIRSSESGEVASVTVRYWAAARAAAGVDADQVAAPDGTTLAGVLAAVRALHPDRPRLPDVLAVCSVLVGDRPVGATDPADVVLAPGDTVELLPPFAGG